MSDKQYKPEERTEENLAEAREEILAEVREEILAEAREEARKETREKIGEDVDNYLKRLGDTEGIQKPNRKVSIGEALFLLRVFVGLIISKPPELKAKYRDQA